MAEITAAELTRFWIDEVGPQKWYIQDETLDTEIRQRFQACWQAALDGEKDAWCDDGPGVLGFLILTDQLPRNMFRGDARSFATDSLARAAAWKAIDRRWDLMVPEPERQFFYLPLMHSEALGDQDACIRLMSERMTETGASNLLHARAHREIVRRFGRFPYRNAAFGRMTLPVEQEFLDGEGYAGILRGFQAKAAG
ncbi:DUF924 family protein [Aliiruegeria lutimaris]|uniref:Uncharacterized conserved protein, DUF924 family n=1 Tax=Aliiruegeria lutimaris TaxID=571298 RepID=A0A1G8J7T4_9RHOB|nr:DUF924 family protein [Aliiruegeria lutimaris]SDI27305.1 Uncharacterized conserved protein, DUF924 family [Aliiruegeria lutimaris]